ncbi:MAG: trypsin-like serine protease [Actinobacteria bacterium]|uniref:Unannotated protein n=1 Tax=freshwater metagenome TaxID=449393 RepID=A0A6J7HZD1_9ZZZZ|nr:trypsin-like serine protease [Actinomycetota bacterium]MTA57882.1 trypsin-like serine protease [Actinomycetota bacterium]
MTINDAEVKTSSFKANFVKVGAGFLLGSLVVGGAATAASSDPLGVKACVDKKTQVMYLSTSGACSSTRTLVSLGGSSIDVKSIAALVTPSVVSIEVTTDQGTGTGSGSIYQSSATSSYIITNNHVVESAADTGTITVEMINGDNFPATIVGRDATYDIAVIKINKGNLPIINIGDSSKLSVGDPVVAIGSPLGLASTVTSGIVSALNRPVTTGTTGAESFVDAIQTDAAINPGNSGGALLDSAGRIVGVNSAIATLSSDGSSGNIGLGFSIPINEAKRVVDELIATGKSTRPYLGIYFDTTFTGTGAKILKLSPGEAADKAGIPAGAIIRSIDGVKIADQVGAIVRIRSYAPGATVTILVDLPTGGQKSFKVLLGSAPSN